MLAFIYIYREDFIVVAEFSEKEGPIPLFTVPNDFGLDSFDINSFVLRIMSVDYQAKSRSVFSCAFEVYNYSSVCLAVPFIDMSLAIW